MPLSLSLSLSLSLLPAIHVRVIRGTPTNASFERLQRFFRPLTLESSVRNAKADLYFLHQAIPDRPEVLCLDLLFHHCAFLPFRFLRNFQLVARFLTSFATLPCNLSVSCSKSVVASLANGFLASHLSGAGSYRVGDIRNCQASGKTLY